MRENFAVHRHNARLLVIQKLFHDLEALDGNELDFKNLNDLDESPDKAKYDSEYAEKLLHGVMNNLDTIDKIIKQYAPEWPSMMDLCILRLAIFEGVIGKLSPIKVAINEAIELSKEFSNDQSRKFISGFLGALVKNLNGKD